MDIKIIILTMLIGVIAVFSRRRETAGEAGQPQQAD
jgi:hypothetical protein